MNNKYNSTFIFFLFISFFLSAQTGNVKLGNGAGVRITLGDYNIMVGDSAAFKLTSGSLDVFLGRRAGFNVTSGQENVFIGADAGYSLTSGQDNVFIGRGAGSSTNDTDNVFIGTFSGRDNTFGSDNTFIGEESGLFNTSGDDNTFIGEDAGYNNTTASDNTFIGSAAGRTNTTGFRNTAIGAEAGYDLNPNNTFGTPTTVIAANYASYNTFVGDSTGVDVGRGAYNTFVGQAAGAATEGGSRNTFVGFRAGYDNNRLNNGDQGHENTYFGFRTGHKNRTGSYNVLIGSKTDFTGTGTNSNHNNYNVAIGYDTRVGDTDNNIITLGKLNRVNNSNIIAIGNEISTSLQNTMILGGVTNRVTVGIGTVAPNRKASLDLADTDKGFLINRLTTAQKTTLGGTLTATDLGMLVYDTDEKSIFSWDGIQWVSSSGSSFDPTALEARITALEAKAIGNSTDKTPLLFNYQTALLNASNLPLSNTTVSFRISILQTTNTGSSVYQETHSATTNSNGITSFKIGNGTVVSGNFSTINWGNDIYFLKVEADVAGGINYTDFGTSQFVTVPYAMHARTADRLTSATSAKTANTKTAAKSKVVSNSEIETLKQEVKELKAIVAQLQKTLKK